MTMMNKMKYVVLGVTGLVLAACSTTMEGSSVPNPEEIKETTEQSILVFDALVDSVVRASEALGEAVDKILD